MNLELELELELEQGKHRWSQRIWRGTEGWVYVGQRDKGTHGQSEKWCSREFIGRVLGPHSQKRSDLGKMKRQGGWKFGGFNTCMM